MDPIHKQTEQNRGEHDWRPADAEIKGRAKFLEPIMQIERGNSRELLQSLYKVVGEQDALTFAELHQILAITPRGVNWGRGGSLAGLVKNETLAEYKALGNMEKNGWCGHDLLILDMAINKSTQPEGKELLGQIMLLVNAVVSESRVFADASDSQKLHLSTLFSKRLGAAIKSALAKE